MSYQSKTINAGPVDFNQLGRFGEAVDGSWAKLPTYYYDLQRTQAPLNPDSFDEQYGSTVALFADGSQSNARQTNAATGRTVTEMFCAVGASIVAVGEGEAFSVPGAVVPLPANNDTDIPAINSCVGSGAPEEDHDNAVFQFGSPIWTAIEKMFLGYRFIMQSSRFILVDELLMDIGMSPAPPEFIGSGDMLVSGMPAVRDANQVLIDSQQAIQFIPQNVQTVEDDSLGCVGAPLVPAMKGHPRIVGMSKRVFCFNHPICFFPGMTFQASFVQTDATLIQQARNSLSVRNDTPGPRYSNTIAGGGGLRGNVVTVPGGTLHMGLILKGFALQPKAALDYLTSYLPRLSGAWSDMYANNTHLGNLILTAARQGNGVRGLLAGSKLEPSAQKDIFDVLKKVSGNENLT